MTVTGIPDQTGCDNPLGDVCTVTMNSDHIVHVNPWRHGQLAPDSTPGEPAQRPLEDTFVGRFTPGNR